MGIIRNQIIKVLRFLNLQVSFVSPRSFERYAINGKDLVGVEIGVYKGEHAESMLKSLNIKKLYLIDFYDNYKDYKDGEEHYGIDQDPLNIAEQIMKDRLKKYFDNIEFIKKKSSNAIKKIPDNLDFVYIDGNHEYEYVKEDIENYYLKVKKGGIIGGHDFDNGFCKEHDGVVKAVLEFVSKNKLKLVVANPDWWVVKE